MNNFTRVIALEASCQWCYLNPSGEWFPNGLCVVTPFGQETVSDKTYGRNAVPPTLHINYDKTEMLEDIKPRIRAAVIAALGVDFVRDGRQLMQNDGMGKPTIAFHPKNFTLWIPPWEDLELVPPTALEQ